MLNSEKDACRVSGDGQDYVCDDLVDEFNCRREEAIFVECGSDFDRLEFLAEGYFFSSNYLADRSRLIVLVMGFL